MLRRLLLLAACGLAACLPGACQSAPRPSAATSAGIDTLADAVARARATATSNTSADRAACTAATQRAAILWLAQTGGSTKPVTVHGGTGTFTLSASWPGSLLFDELVVAPSAKSDDSDGLLREGVGAPLLAHWKYSPERKVHHPLMSEAGYIVPVTATLDFRGSKVALCLHDPRLEQTVVIGGHCQTLAADFAAVDRWIQRELQTNKQLGMSGLSALRHSDEHLSKIGIFSLEPPSRDRIPVILVHGLMSRPLTWQHASSALSADPGIARRYQFYYFRYPTGVPVAYSAAKCREGLALLKRELDRAGNTAYRHNMVLIGHSMGGLVSKSQLQSSGDRVWIATMGAKPADLHLSKAQLDELRPMLEFEPNPDVSRVVFVCTPHRGSKLAMGFLGSIGRRLIKLPVTVLGTAISVLPSAAPSSPLAQQMSKGGSPSSIGNLSPESLYVKESMKLPLKPGLHIHSIIGNKKGLPLDDPKCSDGVVPYTSAHLNGVESELVVHSGHSAHERPETIAELRRILLLHLAR